MQYANLMDLKRSSYILPSETSSDEASKAPSSGKPFKCPHCGKLFSRSIKLAYHVSRHTNERPFVCDVLNCNKSYAYPNHLRRHKDISHSDQIKHKLPCTNEGCLLQFSNKYSLNKHIKRKHNPNREYAYKCDYCNEGFNKKYKLLHHTYSHTGVSPFVCDECGVSFSTAQRCDRHMRTHTSYECECGKTFERWSDMLGHRKSCSKLTPKCHICDKTFKHKSNLKKHLELHVNSDDKVYICSFENCKKEYLYKKNLDFHINKHHKHIEKPRVKCTHPGCERDFSKNQNLLRHIELEHKQKNTSVEKKQRNLRKDKGISKQSAAAVLTGVDLPINLHKNIMQGKPVEPRDVKLLCSITETNSTNNEDNAEPLKTDVNLDKQLLQNVCPVIQESIVSF